MKVLMQMDLAEELIEKIRQVAEVVEVVCVKSDAAALEVMPEIEVVCGHISQEMFARRKKLKWMQSWGAGVDGVLHPELVESDVVLCSAKGWVGVHLAEHAMALLLGLTRGIHTAVRYPDWDRRWAIRAASWELVEQTMGIVGLGGDGEGVGAAVERVRDADHRSGSRRGRSAGSSGSLLGDGSVPRAVGTIRRGGGLRAVDRGD